MLSFLLVILNRQFRSLWLGQIASQIAINMMAFVLLLRIYEVTSSNTAVSFTVLAIGLPAVFFGILAGTLVDRVDKRAVLIYCNLFRCLLVLGFVLSSETLPWVYALAAGISIITQFFVPAEAPTIPRLVGKKLLLTANSLFTFSFYLSMIVGFVFAGPALKIFGPQGVFIFISGLLLLAALFVSGIPKEEKRKNIFSFKKGFALSFEEIKKDISFGFSVIYQNKTILGAIALLTASQALIASLAALSPGFADKILQIELTDASLFVMGPAALGVILGAFWVGGIGRRFEKSVLIDRGIISAGFLLLLLSFLVRVKHSPYLIFKIKTIVPPTFHIGSLAVAEIILFLLGMANVLIDIPANTLLQEEAEDKVRGRIYGVLTALVGGAAILPVLITGFLADFFGVGKTIFGIGSLIFIFGAYRVFVGKFILSSRKPPASVLADEASEKRKGT